MSGPAVIAAWTGAVCVVAAVAAVLVGCSPSWSDADTKSAQAAARAQAWLLDSCADGGRCEPAEVRALERAAFCANDSMLTRHGQAIDAGISCRPR